MPELPNHGGCHGNALFSRIPYCPCELSSLQSILDNGIRSCSLYHVHVHYDVCVCLFSPEVHCTLFHVQPCGHCCILSGFSRVLIGLRVSRDSNTFSATAVFCQFRSNRRIDVGLLPPATENIYLVIHHCVRLFAPTLPFSDHAHPLSFEYPRPRAISTVFSVVIGI